MSKCSKITARVLRHFFGKKFSFNVTLPWVHTPFIWIPIPIPMEYVLNYHTGRDHLLNLVFLYTLEQVFYKACSFYCGVGGCSITYITQNKIPCFTQKMILKTGGRKYYINYHNLKRPFDTGSHFENQIIRKHSCSIACFFKSSISWVVNGRL